MATDNKVSYPTLPTKHWWMLRKKFRNSVPTVVNPSYVATALGMQVASARANVIPALSQLGMIDESGKPTQLVHEWRDDSTYKKVCNELFDKLYPSELTDAIDRDNPDRVVIQSWFMRTSKVGNVQAAKMTLIFLLLLEADPTKQNELNNTSQNTSKKVVKKELNQPKKENQPQAKKDPKPNIQAPSFSPVVHIDLQIHISPDASPEQINKIFESISKHLFKLHKYHEE